MVAKDHNISKGPPKAEVGEIDTSAPFQSVKDAVTLFGEGAFSGERCFTKKTKPQSADRVLAKETQLHLARKELDKLKEQLENAETTKAQALSELDRAKKTVEDLTEKLKAVNESNNLAIETAQAANRFSKSDNITLNNGSSNADHATARNQYMALFTELEAAKQELRKTRQEYSEIVAAKEAAIKLESEAEHAIKANKGRSESDGLSKEVANVQDSIHLVKLEIMRASEDGTNTWPEKDKQKQLYKAKVDDSIRKLVVLKKNLNPGLVKNLDNQLAETLSEIDALKRGIESRRASDFASVNTFTSELEGAEESLHKVAEEEDSTRSMVEALKVELENIKREHSLLKMNGSETESTSGNLHVKLRKAKSELEEALAEEVKVRGASDVMIATIHELLFESENAKREAEYMKQQAQELKREVEATRIELTNAENKLQVAIREAEEAKAAEAQALDQIKLLSEKTGAAWTSTSLPRSQITISRDKVESLTRKVEESEKLADMKVEAVIAQIEAVKASENEAVKRLEATQKEIEYMKTATEEALKKAEMAEAAKNAVEGELRRWRGREHKRAAEAACRILAESEKSMESPPCNYQIQKHKPPEKAVETRKLEKAKTTVSRKSLLPSLTSVFHKKKNQVDGRSPSLLPVEKSVW